VRTKEWQLDSIVKTGETVFVSLSTASDASTLAWWPYAFALSLRVSVGAQLTQELVMRNTGPEPLRFEEALHTYYRVGDAGAIRIKGLDGVRYFDNTDNNREKQQEGDIVFAGSTDRAYFDTTHSVAIDDPVLQRRILVTKTDSKSTVVWNPWSTLAKNMADLGDHEWRVMACVEAANMRAYGVDLAPGEEHVMKTVVGVTPLPSDPF
jgi:glucose-6-phosphate 1-epimerase